MPKENTEGRSNLSLANMKRIKYLSIVVVLSLFIKAQFVGAQTGTMMYSSGVPQSYYLNPATQPGCAIFIGIPIASSTYFEIGNSAFGFDNLLYKDSESDSVITPLHSSAELSKFLDNFKNANYISGNFAFNVLSFGFRVKDMYFTYDLTEKIYNEISYPKDLMSFLAQGNTENQVFDLSNTGIHVRDYLEMAIGVSRNFGDMLSVGIRPKLLFGQAIINTSNEDIKLTTSHDSWVLDSKFDMNMCIPGVFLPVNNNGLIDLNKDIKFDSTINSFADFRKLATVNKGLGVDLGVHFRPIPQIQLSASVVDLGYIKWKKYTNTISQDGSYTFTGVDISPLDSSSAGSNILDSLKENLKLTGTQTSFVTHLYPKIIVGGRFFLLPGFDVGAVSQFDLKENTVDPRVYLLADWRPSTAFGVSASYGLFTGSAASFGLGVSFRLGPLSTYLMSDTYPATYNKVKKGSVSFPIPNGVRQFSIRWGVNILIGANYVKKLRKDKPMYYSDEY